MAIGYVPARKKTPKLMGKSWVKGTVKRRENDTEARDDGRLGRSALRLG